jgi:hypothetical protein
MGLIVLMGLSSCVVLPIAHRDYTVSMDNNPARIVYDSDFENPLLDTYRVDDTIMVLNVVGETVGPLRMLGNKVLCGYILQVRTKNPDIDYRIKRLEIRTSKYQGVLDDFSYYSERPDTVDAREDPYYMKFNQDFRNPEYWDSFYGWDHFEFPRPSDLKFQVDLDVELISNGILQDRHFTYNYTLTMNDYPITMMD